MNSSLLLIAVILPMIGGLIVNFLKNRTLTKVVTFGFVLMTSIVLWFIILNGQIEDLTFLTFTSNLKLVFSPDKLGMFFAGIIATLWPFTTLYAFEYLEDDTRFNAFFLFFLLAYGVTAGICLAGNIFTLYAFYELLTLTTFPLVMHDRTREAIRASRLYLSLSIGGAAFAFASMMYVIMNGGVLERTWLTQLFYVAGFFGFGVKAAVFPLHFWLPKAGVAPTPVTALLHAVAVVKAGVFAIIRLTYCVYGVEVIKDSFAQYIPMAFVLFTILYGSTLAVKEIHVKRKMAYSTVANLSYILFGVMLLTDEGLSAGLLHMAFHAGFKILAFFAVGAVMHRNHRTWIFEYDGIAKKMPITFACYTIAALALTGIPPLSGFVSKFSLLVAGINADHVMGYAGCIVLLISALLTAVYSLTVVRRAYFPDREADLSYLDHCKEAGLEMTVPMVILAAGVIFCGLNANLIVQATNLIVSTLMKW